MNKSITHILLIYNTWVYKWIYPIYFSLFFDETDPLFLLINLSTLLIIIGFSVYFFSAIFEDKNSDFPSITVPLT